MQLMHGGRQSYHDQKVAPSAIPDPRWQRGPLRELRTDEIPILVAAFGNAARRCKEAGFDFVEIHGAHGYLINQFLAPNSNKRADIYGGSFENRTRFMLEVLRDIRSKCGSGFTVGIRMNGERITSMTGGASMKPSGLHRFWNKTEPVTSMSQLAFMAANSCRTIPSMYVWSRGALSIWRRR